MKTELIKRGGDRRNKDIAVFIFFLVLAFTFWYLNSLEDEMEAGIRFNVKFTNLPRGQVITERNPEKLNLLLKGPGSAILKLKLSGKKAPVSIDISKVNFRRLPGSKDPDYFIITSNLTRSFTSQLRSECEIISIKPDSLFFSLGRTEGGQKRNRRASGG